jgi:ribosomal protein S18 acetylase RimI-like enzyme
MRVSPRVRRATAQDLPVLAAMLARAFLDDPVARWAWRPERLRLKALERFHGTRLRQRLVDDEVWMTEASECAAMWAPPKRWRTTAREDVELLRPFLHPRLFARAPLVAGAMLEVERRHPREPDHWYLAVLGTDPSAQGRGAGSAVLAPVLELCDADGVGAYLESSKERNIDFYARHGFRVTEELRLMRGPRVWKMWRDPR